MATVSLVRDFSPTSWVANVVELFERAAYYGLNSVLAVYPTNSLAAGGLAINRSARRKAQGTTATSPVS
jgi:dipeptide/tripeptide permease